MALFGAIEFDVEVRTLIVVDVDIVLGFEGSPDGASWKTVKVRRDMDYKIK